tara:strand:+ start:126 stop:305 length:180 start_codon:yes stop_codon:yes gene_type:complete
MDKNYNIHNQEMDQLAEDQVKLKNFRKHLLKIGLIDNINDNSFDFFNDYEAFKSEMEGK